MSIRNIILKLIYPIIECLPKTLETKIKLIGNVIIHDWNMSIFCFFDINTAMPECEARAFFDQSDQETMDILHHQYFLGTLYVKPDVQKYYFFNHTNANWSAPKELRQHIAKAKSSFIAHTGLSDVGPETFFFKHCTVFLSDAEKAWLKGRDIVDAGAYRGESIVVLKALEPGKIFSFEPCRANYCVLQDTVNRLMPGDDSLLLIPKGLGNKVETIYIQHQESSDTPVGVAGTEECTLTTVDAAVEDYGIRPGFIKADVEGAGLALVNGALNTIRKYRPILAIAVYHSADEFIGIPRILCELGYRVRLKCLNPLEPYGEITLLAIPQELQ